MGDETRLPETEDLLARVPLFSRLGRRELRQLGRLCIPKAYDQGVLLIQEGATGLGLFLITSGRVEVFKGEGPERVSLAELGPGDILGELAVIDDEARSASARALAPTACLLITRDSFQTLLRTEPEVAWCVVPVLAERIREMQRRLLAGELTAPQPQAASAEEAGGGASRDEPPRQEGEDALLAVLRAQYAVALAAATGFTGVVQAGEVFVETLAREARLEDDLSGGEVARRLPSGLASAARAALEEGEKLPERVLRRLLRHLRRGDV